MILAMEGTSKLKKEVKAKEGEMAEQDATAKVVSGMHVHLWTRAVIALPICYTDQIS
jgi:flagellar basal body rod protein FlgF